MSSNNNTLTRILVSSHRITPAATVYEAILSGLQQCPSDIYVIVSQPGINAVDFHDQYSAPHLRQKISGIDKNIRSSVSVSDVVGRIDAEMLSTTLQKKCGAGLLRVNASCMFRCSLLCKSIYSVDFYG